jgi:hypothetical protein
MLHSNSLHVMLRRVSPHATSEAAAHSWPLKAATSGVTSGAMPFAFDLFLNFAATCYD